MASFTKYIPLTEDQYQKYKLEQDAQLQQSQQNLLHPTAVHSLSTAQDEQIKTLFENSNRPEHQEQRFKQLFHIVNELKNKVESQMKDTESTPINFDKVKVHKDRAPKFCKGLGTCMEHQRGIDG